MTGRGLALCAGYIAFWTVAWWFATEPSRHSADLIEKLERANPVQAGTILRELTSVYKGSPRQASADYARHDKIRALIASAAAPVPECLPLVEEALARLSGPGRVNVLLTLVVNGPVTLDEKGGWTGTDLINPRADVIPVLRRLLETEISQEAAVLEISALRSAGDSPSVEEVLARARRADRTFAARSAELIVLAGQPQGTTEILRALRADLLPDDLASALISSHILDLEPEWKSMAPAWALDRNHATAAGGAFPALFDFLTGQREQLWAIVSTPGRGKRLPLMLSLMTRTKWPASYRSWWLGVYDDEKLFVPDLEDRLAEGNLETFGRWPLEEPEVLTARALRAIHERLRDLAPSR